LTGNERMDLPSQGKKRGAKTGGPKKGQGYRLSKINRIERGCLKLHKKGGKKVKIDVIMSAHYVKKLEETGRQNPTTPTGGGGKDKRGGKDQIWINSSEPVTYQKGRVKGQWEGEGQQAGYPRGSKSTGRKTGRKKEKTAHPTDSGPQKFRKTEPGKVGGRKKGKNREWIKVKRGKKMSFTARRA